MVERQVGFTSEQLNFDKFKYLPVGIISAVVIDATDGTVLTQAFMDRKAFDLTVQTGQFHSWSRVEKRVRRKGETSGYVFEVVSIESDCDMDGVRVRVNRKDNGPACHTGAESCFDVGPVINFK